MQPFNGSFTECLAHFAATNAEILQRDKSIVRTRLSSVINVPPANGYRWFTKMEPAVGINKQRLMCMLALAGYDLSEYRKVTPIQRKLSYLIGTDTLTVNNVAILVGISTESAVLKWADGRYRPGPEKLNILKQIVEEHTDLLEEKLQEWRTGLQKLGLIMPRTIEEDESGGQQKIESRQAPERPANQNGVSHEQTITTLAHLILALHGPMQQVLSDSFSVEERNELRKKTQMGRSNALFDVSNMFNRLCSERARKDLKSS